MMKVIFALWTFLFFSRIDSPAQWVPLNVNSNSNFIDVQFLNDSVGFVSGSTGAILKTIDYGQNWTNTNNTGHPYNFCLHFPSDSVGYALGQNEFFKTTDQGANWFVLPNVSSHDKRNLFFLNDSTGFFLSAYGVIHKTQDGGNNWSNNTTNCGGTIVEEDVYFPNPSVGYFGGWYGTCASRTNDGGSSWQTLTNNLLYIIKSIYFPTPSTGFMTGWNSAQTSGIEKTIDSGNTWVLLNSIVGSITSIYCIDTNVCYAVGPAGTIVKTTDGGSNWQQQISGTQFSLRKIFCTDQNTCYAVGDSGIVLKTSNGGITGIPVFQSDFIISIYPNPVDERIQFKTKLSDYYVQLFDVYGIKIREFKNQNSLNVSDISDGTYFILLTDGRYKYHGKFIVNHNLH
jgi:photosystem II stability/assembly factor-like uncharacterized protein